MRLLLVEDDLALQTLMKRALTDAGYAVDTAADGEEAGFLGETEPYDAVVLDLGLPIVDGLTVLTDWRAQGLVFPVLILTARDGWREKVEGLRRGADDYVVKPFQTEEVLARLEALIRRSRGVASPRVSIDGLELDLSLKSVRLGDQTINLTPNEFRALSYLGLNRGRVISKTELSEHLYDQDFDHDSNLIEVLIARLRKKVGSERVKTQRGHGYYVE
jgi:two-component system OmpR family response regulator